jgi:ribosomal protein S1
MKRRMSLRAQPVEQPLTLPDGRAALVRVGLFEDDYVPRREIDTVTLDLVIDDEVEATVETLLRPEQDGEAVALAREVAEALGSGELEPTAGAIEPVALRLP